MFGIVLVEALILIGIPVALGIALFLASRSRKRERLTVPPADIAALKSAGRRMTAWRWAALLTGLLAAVVLPALLPLGLGLTLAPLAIALVTCAGVLLGELTGPRVQQSRAEAALIRRTPLGILPVAPAILIAAAVLITTALLVWGWAAGSPDDLGRAGRALALGSTPFSGSSGPWPGSFYALPLLLMMGACLGTAAAAVRTAALRPQTLATGTAVEVDQALREKSASSALAFLGFGTAATLLGVSGMITSCLSNESSKGLPLSAGFQVLSAIAALGPLLALAVAGVSLYLLFSASALAARVEGMPAEKQTV